MKRLEGTGTGKEGEVEDEWELLLWVYENGKSCNPMGKKQWGYYIRVNFFEEDEERVIVHKIEFLTNESEAILLYIRE